MSAKNLSLKDLTPLHPVRSQAKVDNLVQNFNEELAAPILVDEFGKLLNGTHRYRAYFKREKLELEPNFTFVYMEDLEGCWVGEGLRDILKDSARWCEGYTYPDLDHFWHDNWHFAAPFCN